MDIYYLASTILILFQCLPSYQWELVVSKYDVAHKTFKRDTSSASAPRIREFLVKTNVANRFAETSVVSKVENADTVAKQTAFSVVLPERAYISGFYMDIDGKYYNAFVKEKEEAKKIFEQSVSNGQTAAHVAVSTRNSNRFTIHVNVEPESTVVFHLAYEELLQRENGQYEIIANIQPGQIVKKLEVQVTINETHPLVSIRTPYLRSGSNTLVQHNTALDPHSNVTLVGNSSVIVHFQPDINRQLEFACAGLGNEEFDGFAGQFVVKYDIERTNEGGETLFQDGFFLNFFAPKNLDPIPKHIVFVLDTSGSMSGPKIIQLKDAMTKILPQLNKEDLFSIVQFESMVYVWDLDSTRHSAITWTDPEYAEYGRLKEKLVNINLPSAHSASKENIDKAINIINLLQDDGLTNSIGALEVGLFLIGQIQEQNKKDSYQPILVFLTDGLPNVGSSSTANIISKAGVLNRAGFNTPIYSLSFGDDADWDFLEKLSLQNHAKPTRIQIAKDLSKQLQDFYSKISVPLLSNVSYGNLPKEAQITQTNFVLFFNGSEIVVAGKGISFNTTAPISISAKGKNGTVELEATVGIPLTRLEKVWAYLTVKQLADQYHATGNATIHKMALDLALNYSLVTEFTSLVVVKPDSTNNYVDTQDATKGIFPVEPNELPMCNNITEWIMKNYDDFDLETTTELTTTTTTELTTITYPITYPNIVELDFTESSIVPQITTETSTTTEAPTTTETPTTTEAPITTETPTTTEKIITCNESEFGCCFDGVTFSPRPNQNGCDPIPRPESCSLSFARGPCTNITVKWFYNTARGQCTKFRYGGCDGNGNRFGSKESCESTCVNVSGPDQCKLPIYLGSCYRYNLTWFYDANNDECIKYMYRGCFGNSNRFPSKQDCLRLCSPKKLVQTIHDSCLQPKDKGNLRCNRFEIKFYYNTETGQCHKFWFSGCGGNDNRFNSRDECQRLCSNDICGAPAIKGPCKGIYQQWYFDRSTDSCKTFIFGGCGGNKNKFNSMTECQNACGKSRGA